MSNYKYDEHKDFINSVMEKAKMIVDETVKLNVDAASMRSEIFPNGIPETSVHSNAYYIRDNELACAKCQSAATKLYGYICKKAEIAEYDDSYGEKAFMVLIKHSNRMNRVLVDARCHNRNCKQLCDYERSKRESDEKTALSAEKAKEEVQVVEEKQEMSWYTIVCNGEETGFGDWTPDGLEEFAAEMFPGQKCEIVKKEVA